MVSHAREVISKRGAGSRLESTREDSRRRIPVEGIELVVRGWLQEDPRGLLG